jgi:16S rRNA (guanine966-N2)-methyltransferase
MRIVAGALRGRILIAPQGRATRPTADRVRQALFDMLLHAPWGGRALLEDAVVMDAFAGTGAMGLEALSRGAARSVFIESDPAALRALQANIATCRAGDRCRVVAGDVLGVGRGEAATLALLDPPYGQGLLPRSVAHLAGAGWLAPGALIVAETGRGDGWLPGADVLAERIYGTARVVVYRLEESGAVRAGVDC